LKEIIIQKFTSYGNNFVIVDETQSQQLREEEKSGFACQVTNVNFGIGADGVLFLQPYRSDVLAEINSVCHYWDRLPVLPDLNVIFRIFEPNGAESFSCGNGLMCLANFLNRQYSIASTRILTQIPTRQPKVITIGTQHKEGTNWANMGSPRRVPQDIVTLSNSIPLDGDIDLIDDISITFRAGDLHPFSSENTLKLKGYLVYTGEPHLVIFPETDFSIAEIRNLLFVSGNPTSLLNDPHERRIRLGSWLVNHIGTYLNKQYSHTFPKGININFVHLHSDINVAEYRCFERGIDQETLACGTGALAVSFVARRLQHIKANQITVWPHRSRWYDPRAFILVSKNKNGWSLSGRSVMLLEGTFRLENHFVDQIAAVHSDNSNQNQDREIQQERSYQLASLSC
jgi:diaminopimelate epimerase